MPTSDVKRGTLVLLTLAERTKCWMCKRAFDRPVLLPVETDDRGQFRPNVNPTVLFHLSDTHGVPADTVYEWIVGSVYGWKLDLFGIARGRWAV